MKTRMMILMAMLLATGTLYGTAAGQTPPIPSEEQPEVLTQGPVNEAFAQPVNLEVRSGFTAPERPPADIDEIPPVKDPKGVSLHGFRGIGPGIRTGMGISG